MGVRQHTQDVCGCPSAHTGRLWMSVSTHRTFVAVHLYTYQHIGVWTQHACPSCGLFGTSVGVRQHTQDVCVCPSADTGRPLLSVFVRQDTQDVSGCPSVHISALHTGRPWVSTSIHKTSVAVLGCPSAHTGHLWLSVCVRMCPSAHTECQWVSVSTQRMSVGVRQHTQDVHGCPCVSMCVRHLTQDVCGCPSVHISARWSLDSARWPFLWTIWVILAHVGCLVITPRTSVGVRQHTQDVRVCPSGHTGRLWLSISTHISTLVLGLSTLTVPMDCSSDFGPRGLSVQYTQDVRGCPPAHTGRTWLSVCVRVCLTVSVSTHRTSVAVHQYTYQHVGPWTQLAGLSHGLTSVAVRQHTQDVCGCPCVSISTHRTSVAVHQYTYQTLVLGLSTLALPVDCSGDFGPRGLSVQYTLDVRGTLALPVDYLGDFGSRGLSVQYTHDVCGCPCMSVCVRQHTQDVRGCPSGHISARWTSVGVHQHTQDVRVCPSGHTGRLWLSISTHISTLVLGPSTLTLPMDCSSDFGPRGLSVQYTQDVRGCPPAHTGRPWLSVCVRVCLTVSVSTHRTSVAVHQYTYQHIGPWTQLAGLSRGLTSVAVRQHTQDVCGCPCVSVSTHRTSVAVHQYTYQTLVLGLSTLALPVDCSGDFGPRGLSVQYTLDVRGTSVDVRQHTQDVRGCPSVHISAHWLHTGRLCVSVSTHRTSVGVRQHTQDVCVCPSADTGRPLLSVFVRQHTQDVSGCPSVHISARCTHRTSLGVHQHTQDVCGCPWLSVSTHRTFVAVRVCSYVSVSTHKMSVGVRQHTQDVHGCPCVSMCVRHLTQDVCGCPSVHISARWSLDSARWPFLWTIWVILAHVGCLVITPRTSVGVRQHTQDVRVCPSGHTGRLWLSISTHISTLVLGLSTLTLPMDCLSDFGPRGLSVQYTQDVRGCPPAHTGRTWLSVCVRVCLTVSVSTHRTSVAVHQYTYQHVVQYTQDVCGCLPAHTGRPWLSISTHISKLVLGLSSLAFPMDCLVDFGPRGLSVQYTQDVCGCPPAHTGRLWLSASTHRMSVAVRVCPSAHTGRPWLSIIHTGRPWVSISTHMTSVGVRQHTQDVCGCPSAHTGRLWMSVSTHRTFVAVHLYTYSTLVFGLSTLALPVDCSGDFGPRGLFVQYTQDVCVCPSAHTGRLCVSVSTHRTSVGVRQHTQDVCVCPSADTGRPLLSVFVRQHTQDVSGCPSVHISARCTHRTSLGVHQHTQDVCGCPWLSVSTHRTFVAVRVCSYVSVSTHRMSVGVRQHTQDVHGCPCVSMCVRHLTQDVCGCPSVHISARWSLDSARWPFLWTIWVILAHVGCLVITPRTSVGVRQHTQDVRVCPSGHTGRLWLSISTHISTLVLGLSTLTLPMDCSSDFGPRGLSVQYTQDVRGCPPAHTGRTWLSVCVRVCLTVSVSTHRTSVAVHQYTYQHVGPWTQLAGLSHGLTSVAVRQHTQDVCGCPPAHTGRLWLSVCVRQHTQDVRGCPSVHISDAGPWTQHAGPSRGLFGTSVDVRQHTQDVCGCPSAHTGRSWLSICTHISTLVFGLSTLALPVDCSGDFGPRGLFVQYTQDVCVCPSAHTGRLWVFVSTHRTSVYVRQQTQDVRCCPCLSARTHRTSVAVHHTHRTSLGVHQHTQDVCGCPWLSVSTHRTFVAVRVCSYVSVSTHRMSVGVRQHTQDVHGCPCVSMCVRHLTQDVCGCPSVHISARWSLDSARWPFLWTIWVILAHVGCLVITPRTSVGVRQHTQDVRVCPSGHTGRLWLSISTHISTLVLGLSTLTLPMDCSSDFGPRGLSVQYTQDVRGCPPAHTGRTWLSVCVRVCLTVSVSTHRTSVAVHQYTYQHVGPWTQLAGLSGGLTSVAVRQHRQDVCGCPCVSVSTHRTSVAVHQYTYQTLVLGLSMLALPVDCSGDFGPRGLSVQYTLDVRGTSVDVRQHKQDVRGCPSVHISAHWCLDSARLPFLWTVRDVCGCSSAHTGRLCVSVSRHRTSVAVRVCPPAHTGRQWLSISKHIITLVLGLSTLTLPVDSSDDFGPRGLCVQYTQDVLGCPPAYTRRLWLSLAVRQHTQDICGCPCVFVCVRQHTQNVSGCPSAHTECQWVSVSTHRTSMAVHVCPCVSVTSHRTSVAVHQTSVGVRQHTQDVRVCPSGHTGRLWLSISTHISTLVLGLSTLTLPMDCSSDFGPRGLSVQYTQDVRGCPPAHTGRTTHISTLVLGLSSLAFPMDCLVDFGPRGLSVQYTQDVCGCPPAHTGRLWLSASTHRTSVAVRQHTQDVCGCPSAHTGRSWLSICTHISTLVFGLSTLALPVDCSGDFGPRGLFVQYTQDVCVCPSAHTGRLWVFVSTHRTSVYVRQQTQDVRCCPCLSARTHRTSVAVHHTHRTSLGVHQHTQDVCGCPWLSVSTHRTFVAVRVCSYVSVSTHRMSVGVRQHTQDVHGCPCVSMCVRHLTQDVCGCPSVHISARWSLDSARWSLDSARWPFLWTIWVILAHVGCLVITPRTSVGVRQHTQDVRVCPSGHTGRLWLSISTHISTLVLGLSTLTLPMDCSSDFGPRGLSVQYTQDVRGCPPAHTGRTWLSVCVRVCLTVSVSTHRTFVAVHQYTYQHVGPWTQLAGLSRGLTSVGVRQHTQDVCVCPSADTGRPLLSVFVRQDTQDVSGCPSVHISARCTHRTSLGVHQHTQDVCGCPWLSVSTHRTFVAVRVCSYVSVSTHRMSVGVRQHTQDVHGCPCVSMCVRHLTQDVCGCPSVHISARWSLDSARWSLDSARWPFLWTIWVILAHVGCLVITPRTSVGVRQHTQDVRVCPSGHTGRLWLSISTHISTLVLGLSTLTLPMDCSSDFGPRGLSVQYTQDVRGCPPAHTGRTWLSVCVRVCLTVSVSTHRTFVAVHQYTYQHVGPWTQLAGLSRGLTSVAVPQHRQDVCGCPCVSVSTHRTSVAVHQYTYQTLVLGLSTLALPVDCSGDFGPRGLSVQYTLDVRGCPSAHTGHPWVSVSTHRTSVDVRQHTQDVCGCPSAHTGRSWLSICTHISTLVFGLSTLALPVDCSGDFGPRGLFVQYTQDVCVCPTLTLPMDCSGDFGPRGLSVQYTQDVRGCLPAHKGRPWQSVCTRGWQSVCTHGCPSVSVSTHRTSVAVHHTNKTSVGVRQHTQDVCGCLWLSVSTHRTSMAVHQYTYEHAGPSIPVDCSGDFGPRGLSVQYTPDVCGCPSAHTGRPWVFVSTHWTSVAVRQHTQDYTQDVRGCPSAHTGHPCVPVSRHMTSGAVHVCPFVSVRTHRTSMAVHQYTYQHVGPWTQHADPSHGLFGTSVAVRVCPSAHTRRLWLSISIHISMLVLGLSTLAPAVGCLGDFGPRGLCVQYTQDVRGCPPGHTGRLWLSVAVRQHTLAVRQHTLAVRVCPCVFVSTHRTSIGVRQHTHDVCGSPSYTQEVCGCPPAHTRRPWLSVAVRRPWLSISTHISTLVLGLSTLALPVDCSGDIGPRGLSVQYTQEFRGCLPAHAGGPWLSVAVRDCLSAHTKRQWLSVYVRVCPCVSVSTHRTSVAVHQYTYQHAGPWTEPAGPSRVLFG
ncbi:hypothetical protein YC2023_066289 [Brassica napus]